MTTLIDRYLNAVKEQLPRGQQDDVVNELSENLREQIADEETSLGRPLLEAEEAAILKRFGNPMVVAARYRGDTRSVSFGRQLIGPELFPTYLKVLTVNVAITAIIAVAVVLVGGGTAWSSMYGGLVPILVQFAIVTGIFIYADRRFAKDPDSWDPHSIGEKDPLKDYGNLDRIADTLIGPAKPASVPYTTSLMDLALAAIGLSFLRSVGVPQEAGPFAPGPGWADLYAPLTVLFAVALIPPIVTLVRPGWVRFRVAARALFDAAFLILMVISLGLGRWIVLSSSAPPRPELPGLVEAINLGIRIGVASVIVFTAVSLVLEVRRLGQMRP
jgi:HAAS domain-containing protein